MMGSLVFKLKDKLQSKCWIIFIYDRMYYTAIRGIKTAVGKKFPYFIFAK